MKRIGVIANCRKPDAAAVVRNLEGKSRKLGMTLVTCDRSADLLDAPQRVTPAQFEGSIDVLMALGGDGTMLAAVRRLHDCTVPVLGVNLGSLGFMTSVPEDEVERALRCWTKAATPPRTGPWPRAGFSRRRPPPENRSLNDMVVGWGDSSRVITLTVLIDDVKVTAYECDGLIVSTPTGSTGHPLSAGGPILHPETPAFVISVICPHTLSTRPLVVPDDGVLTVQVERPPRHCSSPSTARKRARAGGGPDRGRPPSGQRPVHSPARLQLLLGAAPEARLARLGADGADGCRSVKPGWRARATS